MPEFTTAVDASFIIHDIIDRAQKLEYNKDIYKLINNLRELLDDLSKAEVMARQQGNPNWAKKPREDLAQAIDYAEKILLIAYLCQ
jgi:hypothetical protein